MARPVLAAVAVAVVGLLGPTAANDGADDYAYRGIAQAASAMDCELYLSNSTTPCWQTPSYDGLADQGTLWPFPALDDYSETWSNLNPSDNYVDTDPTDTNGLCAGAFDAGMCCRPTAGCLPTKGFNWILSTCTGTTCGDWGQADVYKQWLAGELPLCSAAGDYSNGCVSDDDQNQVCKTSDIGTIFGCADQTLVAATIEARDEGSQVKVNYVAAYDFVDGQWVKSDESSFNTEGKYAAQDLSDVTLSEADRWMPGPMPGGAVFWNNGYYAGGAKGVGGDGSTGMMFVLSTNRLKNMAFYIMNQATLDRGPAIAYEQGAQNTWACANSGEWDILESSWSQPGLDEDGSYVNLYSTMSNQGDAGRALWPSTGASGAGVGGFGSECYVTGSESVPQITVAVIDSTGSYTYSFPSDQAEAIWPGITATTAADTLQASPAATPDSSPCKEPSSFCGVFAPFSQATTTQELADQAGFAPNDRGFCGNFLQEHFEDTQASWGSTPAVLGDKAMPWNVEMECGSD